MRNVETAVFGAATAQRAALIQTIWNVVNMFFAVNGLGIPFVFIGDPSPAKFTLGVMATIAHLAFAAALKRAEKFLGYLDVQLSALERLDRGTEGADSLASRVRIFVLPGLQPIREPHEVLIKVFGPLCLWWAMLWLGMTLYQGFFIFL